MMRYLIYLTPKSSKFKKDTSVLNNFMVMNFKRRNNIDRKTLNVFNEINGFNIINRNQSHLMFIIYTGFHLENFNFILILQASFRIIMREILCNVILFQ